MIGLTGGIGSGKSAAAAMFAELGAAVVDTDTISRELTGPGGAAMDALCQAFGGEYITPDAALDRGKMRRLVFQDPEARKKLEAILHPMIRAESRARIAKATAPYVVVVVPLLFETGAYRNLTHRVVVVDAAVEHQIRRTVRRAGLAEDEVRAIIAAQLPRPERLARADDVLANDGSIEDLSGQVAQLHAKYLELARRA